MYVQGLQINMLCTLLSFIIYCTLFSSHYYCLFWHPFTSTVNCQATPIHVTQLIILSLVLSAISVSLPTFCVYTYTCNDTVAVHTGQWRLICRANSPTTHPSTLSRHTSRQGQNVLPKLCVLVCVYVFVGVYVCWWCLCALVVSMCAGGVYVSWCVSMCAGGVYVYWWCLCVLVCVYVCWWCLCVLVVSMCAGGVYVHWCVSMCAGGVCVLVCVYVCWCVCFPQESPLSLVVKKAFQRMNISEKLFHPQSLWL